MATAAGSKRSLTLSGEIQLSGKAAKALEVGVTERRAKARISQPFPTKAQGTDAAGESFEIDCAVDNISSSGVYLRLPRQMESGAQLDLVIKFETVQGTGARAFLRCQVLRIEPQADGFCGLAMAISYYRFL
jgi:PilZ domain